MSMLACRQCDFTWSDLPRGRFKETVFSCPFCNDIRPMQNQITSMGECIRRLKDTQDHKWVVPTGDDVGKGYKIRYKHLLSHEWTEITTLDLKAVNPQWSSGWFVCTDGICWDFLEVLKPKELL